MVPRKRLDFGFYGGRSPIIPKAPRSIRRRCSRKNSTEDNTLCAFELLAAVAGKLLQESESSVSSNVEAQVGICVDENVNGLPTDEKTPKSESTDHGSSAGSSFMPETSVQGPDLSSSFKGIQQTDDDSVMEHISICASPDVLKKLNCDSKLETHHVKDPDRNTNCKVWGSIFGGNSVISNVEGERDMHLRNDTNTLNVKDPIEECVNSNMQIKLDDSVLLPLYRDSISHTSLQKQWNTVKLGIRDDDDNSYGCTKPGTKFSFCRPQPRTSHRRIRKMLSSKYRNMAPKLRHCELYNSRDGNRSFYQNRKRIYTQERCLQAPIKKRKLIDQRNTFASDQDAFSNGISDHSPKKGMWIDKNNSAVMLERVSGASATVRGHKKSKDCYVKFSIKSFKVPELYIEVPETATVGSMKRTVMEAITAILGRGLRVGVVLHGKKVLDDKRTLQQAGISQNSNLDTLGFTLEPSFTNISPSTSTKKHPPVLVCDTDGELMRSSATPMFGSGISNVSEVPHFVSKVDDMDTSDFMSSPQTPTNEMVNGAVPDSKALLPVPPANLLPLPIVPLNSKNKKNELSRRRTRRPFSVGEVEALVEAVENLGTGRWRDVKMGAFENADHRTYVDLKDKWKTLVHTAGISPHQRRGEPVPQELLDRVLAATSVETWKTTHR